MINKKARLRYPRGHLWSRVKFASSVGLVQEEVVRRYIENQESHPLVCGGCHFII